jgi:hypothetical protein
VSLSFGGAYSMRKVDIVLSRTSELMLQRRRPETINSREVRRRPPTPRAQERVSE